MSLVRIALRIAAVQALRGRTLVGDNVLDSQIGALDMAADGSLSTDQKKPWIAVYTDASSTKDSISNVTLRALTPNGATQILIETGLTAAHVVTDPETEESTVYTGIPDTDDAFELHADIVARQIADVLTDPDNGWAEIVRSFILSFRAVERVRTSGDQNGTRLAAQQIRITADLVVDPLRGEPLKDGSPMKAFFDKCEADLRVPNPAYPAESDEPTIIDPVIASTLALMRAQIEMNAAPYDWQTVQRRFGLNRNEADGLLITPPPGVPGDATFTDIASPDAQPETHDYDWQPDEGSPV
ncbi:hypothetical protein [Pseudochelatococcus sp. G4_1912]|uniref:hypothetical protein n=1 Tax=Pseudochelatococcus sp. G4_1912 TaxID=3114288 RepID=UPI0039C71BEA